MIKIFKDKKNIAILSSLVLGALGVGMSAVALTKRPPCPPPKPEMHSAEHFDRHEDEKGNECPDCKHAHDGCKGECKRECPSPRHGKEHGGKFDCERCKGEERPELPKKDLENGEKSEQSKND